MMGDQRTSDTTLLSEWPFAIQPRDRFLGQPLHNFALGTSVPSSSNYLRPQPPPIFQLPVDHRPAVSFRQDGHDEWSSGVPQPASAPATGQKGRFRWWDGQKNRVVPGCMKTQELGWEKVICQKAFKMTCLHFLKAKMGL